MARKPKVSLEFKKEPVAQKIIFGQNVHTKMLASASTFTDPDPSMADLASLNAALATATEQAESGDHEKIAIRNAVEKLWDEGLTKEANYVDTVAAGAEVVILLSGFKATVINPVPTAPTAAPENIKAVPSLTIPGGAHVQCNVIDHVNTYMYFIANAVDPIVLTQGTFLMSANPHVIAFFADTHNKIDLTGLPNHASLYVTIIGLNRTGYGAASNPVSFHTL